MRLVGGFDLCTTSGCHINDLDFRCKTNSMCVRMIFTSRAGIGLSLYSYLCPCVLLPHCRPPPPTDIFNWDIVLVGYYLCFLPPPAHRNCQLGQSWQDIVWLTFHLGHCFGRILSGWTLSELPLPPSSHRNVFNFDSVPAGYYLDRKVRVTPSPPPKKINKFNSDIVPVGNHL